MMTRGFVVLSALALLACPATPNNRCDTCPAGTGGVTIRLPLAGTDVQRVVATVTGTGIGTPIVQELTISGTPPVASGTIASVPIGTAQTIAVEAFPALVGQPEGDLAIYRGSATVAVTSGEVTTADLMLYPVNGDMDVTTAFPDDADRPRIDHVGVTITGARITGSRTYYLTVDMVNASAQGVANRIAVGLDRQFQVTTYAADGMALHRGTVHVAVSESGGTVAVPLTNLGGMGSIGVDAGFCVPSCTGRVCGDDGCQGSCGGCLPGVACVDGACVPGGGGFPQPPGTVAVNFSVDDTANRVFGNDDLRWKGSMAYDPVTRRITLDPWMGPWAPLFDDGPWTQGGHEPIGATPLDNVWGVTVFATPPAVGTDTYEYGLTDWYYEQTFGQGWNWIGPANGSFQVAAGATAPITAAGQTFPAFGAADLRLTLNINNLDPGGVWDTSAVGVKCSCTAWVNTLLANDGAGQYTLVLSSLAGPGHLYPHNGLLNSGAAPEFVFVLGGVEYKTYGQASTVGVTAELRPTTSDPFVPQPIQITPSGNAYVVVP